MLKERNSKSMEWHIQCYCHKSKTEAYKIEKKNEKRKKLFRVPT